MNWCNLQDWYNHTTLVCLWNGRLNCWSLYIRTGFSWSLYIQTNLLRSLYIMTEMMAVHIYNDWFRIQTITYSYRDFFRWALSFEANQKRIKSRFVGPPSIEANSLLSLRFARGDESTLTDVGFALLVFFSLQVNNFQSLFSIQLKFYQRIWTDNQKYP